MRYFAYGGSGATAAAFEGLKPAVLAIVGKRQAERLLPQAGPATFTRRK